MKPVLGLLLSLTAIMLHGNGYPPGTGNVTIAGTVIEAAAARILLLSGGSTVRVDDQQALDRDAVRGVRTGARVTALGFWSGGVFYASSVDCADGLC